MNYVKLWKVERVFSNKANKQVWKVSSNVLRTYYTLPTKKEAELKAKILNDKFNGVI